MKHTTTWLLILGGALLILAAAAIGTGMLSSTGETIGAPAEVVGDLVAPPTVSDSGTSVAPSTSAGVGTPTDAGSPEPIPHRVASTTSSAPPPQVTPPVGLRIPRLDIDAPVASYGVDTSTGEMEVPENVTEVAWYRFGPAPGEGGSAVLAAHVDLAGQGSGVFFDLDRLDVGDPIAVDHTDGTTTRYRVIARTEYLKDDLPLDAVFSRTGPPVLTLITCGGGFNRSSRSYDSNVVVYAVPDRGAVLRPGDRN